MKLSARTYGKRTRRIVFALALGAIAAPAARALKVGWRRGWPFIGLTSPSPYS
jgi:hypothetical protein